MTMAPRASYAWGAVVALSLAAVGSVGCNVEDGTNVNENNVVNNTTNNVSNNTTNNATNNDTNNATNNATNNSSNNVVPEKLAAGSQRCAAAGVATGGGYIATFCAGGDIAGPKAAAGNYQWQPGASNVLIPK